MNVYLLNLTSSLVKYIVEGLTNNAVLQNLTVRSIEYTYITDRARLHLPACAWLTRISLAIQAFSIAKTR